MKLGGLFSGIGGFELAWQRLGGEVAWMCEVDKAARKVLEARFPGVPIYPDVTEIDVDELEPVDVLTGGSPCQGFSVAGTRAGLEHGESRLFHDYVRILDGLAERGLQWALWENVPGVFSIRNSDGERTFEHVVGALVGSADPVRLDGKRKWNTGLAAGVGRAVAWRVLDSRHFGVAQRRRRVFACVAFGDSAADRAGRALLAVAEGMRGDTASGESSGQSASGRVAIGARGASGYRMTAFGQYSDDDTASTLKQRDHKDATDLIMQAQAFNWQQGDAEYALRDDSSALAADSRPAVLMTMREGKPGGGKGPLLSEESSLTLATGNGQTLFQPQELADGVCFDGYNQKVEVGTHRSLRIGRDSSDFVASYETVQYGVRRLTPVECERLQAFPDGWTEPAGSDSARYRALGNAVTVNTVGWILGRMVDVS